MAPVVSSDGRFAGRVALVTGASRGIGRAIALRLAGEGATVVINHPGEEPQAAEVAGEAAALGADALVFSADVSRREEVEEMIATVTDQIGPIDLLVNNAGILPFQDFFEITDDSWARVHDVNAKGVFICTQAVSRVLIDRALPGRVVSISSISAWTGGAQQVHYCPSKAAVSSLMKSLAIVLGPHGITCNAVLPGVVRTDINRADLTDEKTRYFEQRIPVGRLGVPEDIAGIVAFLLSDDAAYVNGAELLVDGGLFVNLQ
jgi:L-rhamnose 1-dehydrogenase